MAYGSNQPWGLRAVKYLSGSPFTGNVDPYPIQSGYANNIFLGDPVVLYQGYVVSWYDTAVVANRLTCPFLGVFNGCSFQVSGAANVDPASPGEKYWPAGQVTVGAKPGIASIITDPNVVYNVQCNTNVTQAQIGGTAALATTIAGAFPANIVNGNTNTGYSVAYLDGGTTANPGTATANLVIRGFVPVPGNTTGVTYNNLEVLIQNHRFGSRPVFAQ